MRGKDLRDKLRTGERVYGLNVEGYGQPRWPRFLANLNVLDFVWLDTEHAPNNRETVAWALQCYAVHRTGRAG
jgi:2-keto-3-deoxy-L-rhamnonate aldolase RhmA